MLASARRGIIYPNTTRSDSADVPRDFASMVAALEVDVIYGQGTLAARPVSTPGSPGIQGRLYQASDQTPKTFWWDNGTGWDQVGTSSTLFGTRAALPTASAANTGLEYYATDQRATYLSDGSTWYRIGAQAGDLIWTLEPVARTGYALPGSTISRTGIGADLFALWGTTYGAGDGSTTFGLPDIAGRNLVSKGTHADISTVGNNDGTTAASRRPKHKHTVAASLTHSASVLTNEGGALENPGGGWGPQTQVLTVTVGPQTGAEPIDTAPYFVGQVQIKL